MKKTIITIILGILFAFLVFLLSFNFANREKDSLSIEDLNFFKKENLNSENKEDDENKKEIEETKNEEAEVLIEDLNFLFFGDLMLDRHVGEKINIYGLDHLLEKLKTENFTEGYDLVMANLEGAVTKDGLHYRPDNLYDFAFKPEIIAKLKDYNFDIFTLANNHLSDQGEQGINETYQNLSEIAFNYFGCKDGVLSENEDIVKVYKASEKEKQKILSSDDCSAIIMEIKNRKIAFLAFSIVYRDIPENLILEKIEKIKKESDFLIVSPHWGVEYQAKASKKQENLAKKMIEAGADLIMAHHPHVIQNYEIYQGKPIFYSLGNFIFDQYFSKETQEGLAVSIKLDKENKIESHVYKIKTKGSRIEEITEIERF